MPKVQVNSETWTEVLNGAGFCISTQKIIYSFTGDDTEDFQIPSDSQVNSIVGKILYAKSISSFGEVTAVGE